MTLLESYEYQKSRIENVNSLIKNLEQEKFFLKKDFQEIAMQILMDKEITPLKDVEWTLTYDTKANRPYFRLESGTGYYIKLEEIISQCDSSTLLRTKINLFNGDFNLGKPWFGSESSLLYIIPTGNKSIFEFIEKMDIKYKYQDYRIFDECTLDESINRMIEEKQKILDLIAFKNAEELKIKQLINNEI